MDLFQNEYTKAVFAILSVVILFFLYYFITGKRIINNQIMKIMPRAFSKETVDFISDKFTGIVLSGVFPLLIFIVAPGVPVKDVGLTPGNMEAIKYILPGLIILTIFLSGFSSVRAEVQSTSPELRVKEWYPRHIFLSVSGWLIYLFGYELFFRGILWFLCFRAFGFWWAIIINITLYSIVHIPKGRLMTIGALPLGAMFCILSYYTGSFFPAFMIHAVMAISTELFSVFYSKELHYHQAIFKR